MVKSLKFLSQQRQLEKERKAILGVNSTSIQSNFSYMETDKIFVYKYSYFYISRSSVYL